MTRSILEVMLTMLPYAAVGWIALVAGYNQGYTKGYINALEDVSKQGKRTFAEDNSEGETPREAAGVDKQKLEVAPVQQERNIWENPTHRGKK